MGFHSLLVVMGNFGGFVSPMLAGYVVERTGNWNLTFYITSGTYLVGANLWVLMDPVTPLKEQTRKRSF